MTSSILAALLCLAQQPAIVVTNRTTSPRTEIVRVTLPLPMGQHRQVPRATIGEQVAPCVPLCWWGDGSLCAVQAHVSITLAARETAKLPVVIAIGDDDGPALGDDTEREALPRDLLAGLRTEIEDPWGRTYVASLAGPLEDLPLSSSAVRVQRGRAVHAAADGTHFLDLLFYLTTFRGERRAELTLVLDDGAHAPPGTSALGPVRLRSFVLSSSRTDLRMRPRFIAENALRPPTAQPAGGYRQWLLGPSAHLWLGDATAKAFRIDLFDARGGVSDGERQAAMAAAEAPLRAFPDLDWVRATGAFGAHGGPAPLGNALSAVAIAPLLLAWRSSARFGAFGGFGDPEDAAAQGTPRNGPSSLHNVLRWASPELLDAAEGMALQSCLRPTPGQSPRLPADMAAWRQGLAPEALPRPHGFTPLDYEHFSVDLLYDYFWLTGDPLARDELARMGRGLRPLLSNVPFLTCRGEGWCMQGGVAIRRATGDTELTRWLHERCSTVVLPRLCQEPQPCVLAQPPHRDAFGDGVEFDAPWQMAALVHGLAALHRCVGDPQLARAAVRAALVMAGPGWLEGKGPKYLVSAIDASRYMLPESAAMGEGTAVMEMGAFVLAAAIADEPATSALLQRRADFLHAAHASLSAAAADPWVQLYLDRNAPR